VPLDDGSGVNTYADAVAEKRKDSSRVGKNRIACLGNCLPWSVLIFEVEDIPIVRDGTAKEFRD